MYQIIVVENTLSWDWPRSGSGPDGNQTGPSYYILFRSGGWFSTKVSCIIFSLHIWFIFEIFIKAVIYWLLFEIWTFFQITSIAIFQFCIKYQKHWPVWIEYNIQISILSALSYLSAPHQYSGTGNFRHNWCNFNIYNEVPSGNCQYWYFPSAYTQIWRPRNSLMQWGQGMLQKIHSGFKYPSGFIWICRVDIGCIILDKVTFVGTYYKYG